jgi:hypothetical protein
MRDDCLTDLGYDRSHVTYLFQSDAWKDLGAFFHLENTFHVSITRIYRPVDKFMSQKVVEGCSKEHETLWNLGSTRNTGRWLLWYAQTSCECRGRSR